MTAMIPTAYRSPRRRSEIRLRRWVRWWYADAGTGTATAEAALLTPVLVMLLVFVAVVIHRGVDARIRIDDVAHQAARAASIERTPAAATAAAHVTAASALSSAGVACDALTVHAITEILRPGGAVQVTVSCRVDFGDALILAVPDRDLSASAVEPIDTWRSVSNTGSQT